MRSGKPLQDAALEFAAYHQIPLDTAARDLQLAWSGWQNSVLLSAGPAPLRPLPPPPPAEIPSSAFARSYSLHGKTIRVVLHDSELIAEIAPRLEPLLASPTSPPDAMLQATASEYGYHVFFGTTCVATEADSAAARVVFLQELIRSTQANGPWPAILHAGACGTEDQCVIFPAASHSGKTTLAVALMHAGLICYGDDSIPLQRDAFKIPVMPFSLMIREGSWPVVSAYFPGFEDAPIYNRFGENVRFLHPVCPAHQPTAHAAAIVFPHWDPNASTASRPLDTLETLVRLQQSGFWVAHDRESIQAFLDWIQSVRSYEMVYSNLSDAVAFIRSLLR